MNGVSKLSIISGLRIATPSGAWFPFTNSRYTHSFPSDQLQLAIGSRGLENITFDGELEGLGLSPSEAGKETEPFEENSAALERYLRMSKIINLRPCQAFRNGEEVEAVVNGMDLRYRNG
jgi:hypothetical protein